MVGAADITSKLCHKKDPNDEFSFGNLVDGKCTVQHILRFDEDSIFESDEVTTLYLKDSQLSCKKYDRHEPCSITIKLTSTNATSIILADYSHVSGRQIIIDAPTASLIITQGSQIDASGRSWNTKGSDKDNGDQGGSYLGQGGSCSATDIQDKTYGTFDMLPNDDNHQDMKDNTLIGSMGEPSDTSTAGGGNIQIRVDSLTVYGTKSAILADGLPFKGKQDRDHLNGGTGGYIYISTKNKF